MKYMAGASPSGGFLEMESILRTQNNRHIARPLALWRSLFPAYGDSKRTEGGRFAEEKKGGGGISTLCEVVGNKRADRQARHRTVKCARMRAPWRVTNRADSAKIEPHSCR